MSTATAHTGAPHGATPAARVHSTWNATIRTALGATAALALILLAFVWPTRTSTIKDLPIQVVGTDQAATHMRDALASSGSFDVSTAASRDEAIDHITHRESYGAVVVDGSTVEVVTASAASPVATQALQGVTATISRNAGTQVAEARTAAAQEAAKAGAEAAAAQAAATTLAGVAAQTPDGPQKAALTAQAGAAAAKAKTADAAAQAAQATMGAIAAPSVRITDVVPLSADDPRGGGLAVAALPLAMGGMIGGIMISTVLAGSRRRLAATAGYAVLAGLVLALILGPWLGILPSGFLHVWAVIGCALFATAATIVGFNALIGTLGIPLGAIITMFVGNPLSAATAPQEFLPWHWGTIGQLFVPGASSTLLRNAAYFPDASPVRPWLVLLAWSLVGLVCMVLGRHRDEEVVHIEGATEPDAA